MQNEYHQFIHSKFRRLADSGFEATDINPNCFPFQADVIRWACKRGRFGGFQDCGLGKSLQQLESARQIVNHTGGNVLILAPLAVARQTQREAEKFQVACDVTVCKSQSDVHPGINVANYERIHLFDPDSFVAVILDEGSIIKSVDGKIKRELFEKFGGHKYRQTWTATPAPNDFMEIGNQSEFVGAMTRHEMLATYFVHDGGETSKWRLRGHAESRFWEWLASWCVMLRRPSDLGYSDGRFELPPIKFIEHILDAGEPQSGRLFPIAAKTLKERREARRSTLSERISKAAELANNSNEPWVIWCNLNPEGEALAKSIPDAVEVAGRHSTDEREERLSDFTEGRTRVLITKPKIGGFGLNWQHCPNTVVFPTDSYEQWYQMIRRFWRFGQTQQVNVHVIASALEGAVIANVKRKEEDANRMFDELVVHMRELSEQNVRSVTSNLETYEAKQNMEIPEWLLPI